LDGAPVSWLNLVQFAPCRNDHGAMIRCSGKGDEDEHDNKWEVLWKI
jgi:hypothetical protein